MKEFKDLQPGDIIYYYDHCKMKPRKVVSCEYIEEERRIDTRCGYEITKDVKLLIKCERGTDLEIYCNWAGIFPRYSTWSNSGLKQFSCKEAAENELNRLKNYRKFKIDEAQDRVNRYTNIINKYEIL